MPGETATKLPALSPPRARQGGELVERRGEAVGASVPNAVAEIMSGLQAAVAGMNADDVSVELSAQSDGQKSSANFRLRAYRRANSIAKED